MVFSTLENWENKRVNNIRFDTNSSVVRHDKKAFRIILSFEASKAFHRLNGEIWIMRIVT